MIFSAFSILFFWGIIVISYNNPTSTILVKLGFFCFSLPCCYWFYQTFIVITTDDYSIKIKYPFTPEKEINYNTIALIGDSNVADKLILRDSQNRKLAVIGKSIVGIEELKEILKSKISSKQKIEFRNYFRIANSIIATFVSVALVSTAPIFILITKGDYINLAISVFVAMYFLYIINKKTLMVYISYSSITLKHLFKTRIIYMSEIKSIYQETDNKSGNGEKTYTMIKTKKDEIISLIHFTPDDELLFQSCKYYFDNRKCAI